MLASCIVLIQNLTCSARMKQNRFPPKKILFDSIDVTKRLHQIKIPDLLHKCSELPSNISTIVTIEQRLNIPEALQTVLLFTYVNMITSERVRFYQCMFFFLHSKKHECASVCCQKQLFIHDKTCDFSLSKKNNKQQKKGAILLLTISTERATTFLTAAERCCKVHFSSMHVFQRKKIQDTYLHLI